MANKLIATAPSKEELQKLINEFYCSTNWVIQEDNTLFNTKLNGSTDSTIVRLFRGRWRFEMVK